MIHETHELLLDYAALGIDHDSSIATYTTYLHDVYPGLTKITTRPLVIICPGGGYGHHSVREGEAIALKMCDLGYNAVILRYSLKPNQFPCALYELATLVALARKNADEWHIFPDRIVVAGFSAGGHLAASLGTMWNDGFISEALNVSPEDIRPNMMLLCYPVITSGEFAHKGSFESLLGNRVTELSKNLSLENRVTKDTPKCFIWHTFEDATVPLENTLLFASALRREGIRFELHVFPYGSHGLALGSEETNTPDNSKIQAECTVWPELFATWMSNH